nr:hypothetical protein [uncultured Methanoregula sp.]
MKLSNTSSRAVAIITIVVSVIGLIMSPVSAAAAYSAPSNPSGISAVNSVSHHAFNSTQQTARVQAVLANLSQQGVDVSQAQADIAAGNLTAALQWLMAYHKDHPDTTPALNGQRQHAVNATAQAARLQSGVTKLALQGVDVSEVQADIASGNVNAALQWLTAYHKDHPGTFAVNSSRQHAVNATARAERFQNAVTRLSQQGVDVSELQADLASGNMNAAMQWMAAYHKAHPAQNTTTSSLKKGNSTSWQKAGSFPMHPAGFTNQTRTHASPSLFKGGAA